MNTPPKTTNAAFKKMARKLLTTTCLTAAATGAAQATTFNETTDFGNTFLTNTALPVGTDRVVGGLPAFDGADFFKFSGLVGGSNYTLSAIYTGFQDVTVLNSAQGVLNAATNNPASLTGVVPNDGMLIVGVIDTDGGQTYDISLNGVSTATPEPSTFAGAGLALAGALALRSKMKK